jgi:hypothetical protein
MGFITLRTNAEEDQVLDELEYQLRRLDLGVTDRSKAIKEGLRIALSYIKNSPFYRPRCDTEPSSQKIEPKGTVYVERIQGSEIDLDGKRKSKE